MKKFMYVIIMTSPTETMETQVYSLPDLKNPYVAGKIYRSLRSASKSCDIFKRKFPMYKYEIYQLQKVFGT